MLRRMFVLAALLVSTLLHADGRELRIGIEPFFTPRLLISSFQPMRVALEAALGQPVVLLTAPDYRQFVRRIESHEFDVVIIGPHTARYAELQAGYVPTLIGRNKLIAWIVTKREPNPRAIASLNDGVIAMPDALTVTSMLGEEWIRKQNLKVTLRHFDSHNSAALAVSHGDAQAAIINKTVFANLPMDLRESLRVLDETRGLPHMVVLLDGRIDGASRKHYGEELFKFINSSDHGDSFAGKLGFAGVDYIKEGDLAPVEPFVLELKRRLSAE